MHSRPYVTVHNHQSEDCLLLPGWGTDHRIFEDLKLPYNFISVQQLDKNTVEDAVKFLRDRNEKISILGFSMGGYLAIHIAMQVRDLIQNLILVGVRPMYSSEALDELSDQIRKTPQDTLKNFYKHAHASEEAYSHFQKRLGEEYGHQFSQDTLLEGLSQLGKLRLDPAQLSQFPNLSIIHGSRDRIAPVREIEMFCRTHQLSESFRMVPDGGHFILQDL